MPICNSVYQWNGMASWIFWYLQWRINSTKVLKTCYIKKRRKWLLSIQIIVLAMFLFLFLFLSDMHQFIQNNLSSCKFISLFDLPAFLFPWHLTFSTYSIPPLYPDFFLPRRFQIHKICVFEGFFFSPHNSYSWNEWKQNTITIQLLTLTSFLSIILFILDYKICSPVLSRSFGKRDKNNSDSLRLRGKKK